MSAQVVKGLKDSPNQIQESLWLFPQFLTMTFFQLLRGWLELFVGTQMSEDLTPRRFPVWEIWNQHLLMNSSRDPNRCRI